MSLIIATGSNLDSPLENLKQAKEVLSAKFEIIAASRVYKSQAVDYENQPDFFNQVLEFALPEMKPDDVMLWLLQAEKEMGRLRTVSRGPRTIDMDIIFWNLETHHTKLVIIPHPRWVEPSFVIAPFKSCRSLKQLKNVLQFLGHSMWKHTLSKIDQGFGKWIFH